MTSIHPRFSPSNPAWKPLWALAIACSNPAGAVEIHRCIADDGTPVYSDQRCADLGLAERAAVAPVAEAEPVPEPAVADASACTADTPELLSEELEKVLEAGQLNALLGLILWDGIDAGFARALVPTLEQLLASGPLTAELSYRSALEFDDAGEPEILLVDRERLETRWRVRVIERAGCFWLGPFSATTAPSR